MSAFDADFWEERYRSQPAGWSGRPNPQLVAEAVDLTPGAALDVGSGEGADALWLAERGWRVTAVDFATTALQRGAGHAAALGAEVAARLTWVHADLTTWGPGAGLFDLVTAQFMHLPPVPRTALYARLADGVAQGGTLLVVGHDPSDLHGTAHRPDPEMFFTAEEVAAPLHSDRWDVLITDSRPRRALGPDGETMTVRDVVLRARRR
ncbi:MAG: methyltransferase domain-containing protein [Geodermatophilaceae bacterium]|nr:methyltransferase domain-containing protein [Geodermatophilaceae bacterium]